MLIFQVDWRSIPKPNLFLPKTENRKRKPSLMEIKTLDFFVGLSVGAVLGVGGTWLFHRVRDWLGYSEVSRLGPKTAP